MDATPAAAAAAPSFVAAAALASGARWRSAHHALPTGCPRVDAFFGAQGLPPRGITELSGEAGAGKTQLCLQLAVQCALPRALGGWGGTALYLDAEGAFPASRLLELADGTLRRAGLGAAAPAELAAARRGLTDRIRVLPILSQEEVSDKLGQARVLLEGVAGGRRGGGEGGDGDGEEEEDDGGSAAGAGRRRPRALIILDSVAAVYRLMETAAGGGAGSGGPPLSSADATTEAAAERARGLFSLASILQEFNDTFGVPVVVVNQASDVVKEGLTPFPDLPSLALGGLSPAEAAVARTLSAVPSGGRWLRPALGITWDSCVTTRVVMTYPRRLAAGPGGLARGTAAGDDGGDGGGGRTADGGPPQGGAWSGGRRMYLLLSPSRPPAMLRYGVGTDGVRGEGPHEPLPWV
jgi:RecA/RadA recombinase